MPVSERKLPNGKFQVRTPNSIHAKGTTKAKADAQARLLRAIDHGFIPRKKKY